MKQHVSQYFFHFYESQEANYSNSSNKTWKKEIQNTPNFSALTKQIWRQESQTRTS